MKKFVSKGVAGVAVLGLLATEAMAAYVPVLDVSGATAAITGELNSALPLAVGIGGTIIAISIGWKILKRFSKG